MADIPFNIACKELKIAQIAQLNQLFQLFAFSLYIRFYELSCMLMRKNVNNDVSKDSPITEDTNIICKGFPSLPAIIRDRVLYTTGGKNKIIIIKFSS